MMNVVERTGPGRDVDETRRRGVGKMNSPAGCGRVAEDCHLLPFNRTASLYPASCFLPAMSQMRKSFMKNWFAVEALPIYAVVGIVVAGGSWYLTRLARGPTGKSICIALQEQPS
ncbi:hypothetical protein A0H81_08209 [Grifola frondosa]|uniref:Uncharacterized protein n=1 Tax=Grifola frondosa TaxID=5627 RepID=A0A1C7M4D6_GRIFR|nr:hypothetical protein A0H81_08209 [Grifola frondosa]